MWSFWKGDGSKSAASAPSRTPIPKQPTEFELRISEELKNEGNELFKRAKYLAAAEKYTEAITIRPGWTVALVNRANCYKKLGQWKQVEADCIAALEADSQSMKAHYFLGLALEERQEHAIAIAHLEKSYELARDKGETIMDEIWKTIARVNYADWERSAQQRREEDQRLKERLTAILAQAQRQEMSCRADRRRLSKHHAEEQASLERLFERAAAADQPGEIPGCYTCVITMDVFRDPVITPSGFTYENAVLQQHIEKKGSFDPITRHPFVKTQIVQNIGLRSASQLYLKEHPWAWKECM